MTAICGHFYFVSRLKYNPKTNQLNAYDFKPLCIKTLANACLILNLMKVLMVLFGVIEGVFGYFNDQVFI